MTAGVHRYGAGAQSFNYRVHAPADETARQGVLVYLPSTCEDVPWHRKPRRKRRSGSGRHLPIRKRSSRKRRRRRRRGRRERRRVGGLVGCA